MFATLLIIFQAPKIIVTMCNKFFIKMEKRLHFRRHVHKLFWLVEVGDTRKHWICTQASGSDTKSFTINKVKQIPELFETYISQWKESEEATATFLAWLVKIIEEKELQKADL